MEYRRLGRSGVKVSALGLGCNSFGTWVDEKEAARVVHYALGQGINFFDTSASYADGLSEEYLGKALKGRRNDVLIVTKFGHRGEGGRRRGLPSGSGGVTEDAEVSYDPNDQGGSRYYLMKAVEDSLRRLQTDHIDVYMMHAADLETPIEETLRTLNDLIRAGKVRYIASSNYRAYQIVQAMETAKRLNLESFIVHEDLYNLIDRGAEQEQFPACQAYGMGFIPYRPLYSGLLSGKYRRGQAKPPGSRYDVRPDMMRKDFLSDHNFDLLEQFEKFAKKRKHTLGELAIAWLLAHPEVSSVIAGSVKTEQIKANIKGAEWKLTPEELAEVNKII